MEDPVDLGITRLLKSQETQRPGSERDKRAWCGVCGKRSSSGTVELSQEMVGVVLQTLLVDFTEEGETCHLVTCAGCCSEVFTLVDIFRQLENLRGKFNRLRRRLGRQVILKSLGISQETYEGWVEAVKSVEDVFPSGAKRRLRGTRNVGVGGTEEDEDLEVMGQENFEISVGDVKEEFPEEFDGMTDDFNDDFELCAFPVNPTGAPEKQNEDDKLSKMKPFVLLKRLQVPEKAPAPPEAVSIKPRRRGGGVEGDKVAKMTTAASQVMMSSMFKRQVKKLHPQVDRLRKRAKKKLKKWSAWREGVKGRPFKCPKCTRRFTSQAWLDRHFANRHGHVGRVKPVRYMGTTTTPEEERETSEGSGCTHCDMTFPNRWMLRMHQLRRHLLEVPGSVQCRYCKELYMDEWTLDEHMEKMHSIPILQIDKEKEESSKKQISNKKSRKAINSEKKTQNPEKIHCSVCRGLSFSSVEDLESHVESEDHQNVLKSKNSVYCNVCRLHFGVDIEALQTHLKSEAHLKEVKDLGELNTHTFCIPCRVDCGTLKDLANHNNSTAHRDVCSFRSSVLPGNSKVKPRIVRKRKVEGDRLDAPEKCPICKITFIIAGKLQIHMKALHNKEGYKCDTCDKHFAYLSDLKSHNELEHHNVPSPFICDRCGRGFARERNLKAHVQNIHGGKVSECVDCGKVFTNPVTLRRHRKVHTVDSSEGISVRSCACPFCPEKLRLAVRMRRHCYEKHPSEYMKDLPHVCLVCFKVFPTEKALNESHMDVHASVKCPTCGKYLKDKTQLETHLRSHTGERPFVCSFCDKKFSNETNMKDHMSRHKGDTPFTCSSCGKGFARDGLLKRHKKQTGH